MQTLLLALSSSAALGCGDVGITSCDGAHRDSSLVQMPTKAIKLSDERDVIRVEDHNWESFAAHLTTTSINHTGSGASMRRESNRENASHTDLGSASHERDRGARNSLLQALDPNRRLGLFVVASVFMVLMLLLCGVFIMLNENVEESHMSNSHGVYADDCDFSIIGAEQITVRNDADAQCVIPKELPLCAELVSPPGCESVVGLPIFGDVGAGNRIEAMVVDRTGRPLVRVLLECTSEKNTATSPNTSNVATERLTLLASGQNSRLGFAELLQGKRSEVGHQPQFAIHRANGELHARLEETYFTAASAPRRSRTAPPGLLSGRSTSKSGAKSFTLTCAKNKGWQLRIHGNVSRRGLAVADASSCLVASVEPGGGLGSWAGDNFYCLRVVPKADIGLLFLVLLSIDRLSNLTTYSSQSSISSDDITPSKRRNSDSLAAHRWVSRSSWDER